MAKTKDLISTMGAYSVIGKERVRRIKGNYPYCKIGFTRDADTQFYKAVLTGFAEKAKYVYGDDYGVVLSTNVNSTYTGGEFYEPYKLEDTVRYIKLREWYEYFSNQAIYIRADEFYPYQHDYKSSELLTNIIQIKLDHQHKKFVLLQGTDITIHDSPPVQFECIRVDSETMVSQALKREANRSRR